MCNDLRSTSLNTQTDRIPSSRQARRIRTAISPRLAIKIFLNIEVERGKSLAWRKKCANPSVSAWSVRLLPEPLKVPPLDQDNVVFLEHFLEFRTGDKMIVSLAPRRTVVGMVERHRLELRVVVTKVHDHFRKPRPQILDGRFVKLFPAVRVDGRVGHHHRIHDGILSRELRGGLERVPWNTRRQERQTVFVSDLHIHSEETGPREKHAHVTVQMCRPDSRRHSAFNLRANLALRLLRLDILRGGRRFRPQKP